MVTPNYTTSLSGNDSRYDEIEPSSSTGIPPATVVNQPPPVALPPVYIPPVVNNPPPVSLPPVYIPPVVNNPPPVSLPPVYIPPVENNPPIVLGPPIQQYQPPVNTGTANYDPPVNYTEPPTPDPPASGTDNTGITPIADTTIAPIVSTVKAGFSNWFWLIGIGIAVYMITKKH